MRSVLSILVVIGLVGLVALAASPLLGLQALRDGLAARDQAKLADIIDADQLRASISARVRSRYEQAGIKTPVEPVVERLLTPTGLTAGICDEGVIVNGGPQPRDCDVHASLGDVRFESENRFSAALTTQSGRIAATVVMDRVGLHWRLVDLVLPASAYDQLKNSVLN